MRVEATGVTQPLSVAVKAYAGRVLIVDDSGLALAFLEAGLTGLGFEAVSAQDALAAQELCRDTKQFDCLLTDYRMPGVSGLELLEWVRKKDPTLATVLITTEGEKDVVEKTLHGGACGFLEKPVSIKDLKATVERAVEVTHRQRRLHEFESAVQDVARVQMGILGSLRENSNIQIEFSLHQKHDAGGDFISQFKVSAHQALVLLTDVSGHDLKAAFLSAYFHGMAQGMIDAGLSVQRVMSAFNEFLISQWNTSVHTRANELVPASLCVCSVLIDPLTKRVEVCSAGTPLPVVVDESGFARNAGESCNYPLGWFSEEPGGRSVTECTGSTVLLWTDGLEDVASELGVSVLSAGYDLLEAQKKNTKPSWLAEAKDDTTFARVAMTSGDTSWFPIVFESYTDSDIHRIDDLQQCWARSLALALPWLEDTVVSAYLLVIREAMLNSLEYGCISGRPVVFQTLFNAETKVLRARIDDPGEGHDFDWKRNYERLSHHLEEGSRGMALIHHFCDHVQTSRSGASMVMEWHLSKREEGE